MKSLVLWGRQDARGLRRRLDDGALVLAWNDAAAAAAAAAGIPLRSVADVLGAADRDAIEEAAMAWTKAWGRRILEDGKSFRELLAWKGVSLWWFAELYLHHSTAAPRRVRTIETLLRLLQAERPDEVDAIGLAAEERVLLERTCIVERRLYHGGGGRARPRGAWRADLACRWNGVKTLATALKGAAAGRPPRPPADARRTVLFLSHAAFWRERSDPVTGRSHAYEHYFERLIPGLDADPEFRAHVVAVGPRAAFRRRGLRQRLSEWSRPRTEAAPYVHVDRYTTLAVFGQVRRATRELRGAWRRWRRSPGIDEAFSHAGVRFGDLSAADFAGTVLLQLPWAVRCYEEMSAVLRDVRPAAMCLYAESSGWGRAAIAACQAERVPTVAIQHGIVYPKYYSYRHEDDEEACPRPDRTAVFGRSAERLLRALGRYPAQGLVTTGSPKFDQLTQAAAAWDREALRQRLGVRPGERLVVVASRFRGIRDTHQSIGTAFPRLVRAVESLDGVRGLVKPHPAEPATAYEACLRAAGATHIAMAAPGAELTELLHAADVLVTVESLSAVEALVLGRPVVVLNAPTNLQELVEAGVALSVAEREDPGPALAAALFDAQTQARLEQARAAYVSELAMGVDGRATQRILQLVKDTAHRRAVIA